MEIKRIQMDPMEREWIQYGSELNPIENRMDLLRIKSSRVLNRDSLPVTNRSVIHYNSILNQCETEHHYSKHLAQHVRDLGQIVVFALGCRLNRRGNRHTR